MFNLFKKEKIDFSKEKTIQELKDYIEGLNRSNAIIEFDPNGYILTANNLFLKTVGYSLEEIIGKHHSIFLFEEDKNTSEYKNFWISLANGNFKQARFKRKNKKGDSLYLEATYNPITSNGTVTKVVKFATDITTLFKNEMDNKAKLQAIDKSNAVIEFDLNGNILNANDNFCKTVGYSLNEIIGKQHKIFMPEEKINSKEYQDFWIKLREGKYFSGTFERIDKNKNTIWLEATYNPVFDEKGNVIKVVKFATDIGKNKSLKQLTDFSLNINHNLTLLSEGQIDNLKTIKSIEEGIFKELSENINSAMSKLTKTLSGMCTDVREVVNNVSKTSHEISKNSENILDKSSELNKSIVQANKAMEYIQENANANKLDSDKATKLVINTKEIANSGSKVIDETIHAMSLINDSSQKITEIVSLIDGIAFQTNLLALNAAVEAARAGEHGRGFAVVAGEVRALAGKSAEAAKDIKQLIEDSVDKIHSGTKLADKSGIVLKDVVSSISEVSTLVESISDSSNKQLSSLNNILKEISVIKNISDNNTSLANQAHESSEKLYSSTVCLNKVIDFFKTRKYD